MTPEAMLLAITLAKMILENVPAGIKAVQDIMLAWKTTDPTGEDFEALAILVETKRPKDPLKPIL
jgi:hypothetical protein